jgi:hypothetical protein
MRRSVVTLVVVALFAACGFPDVIYDGGSGDDDASSHADAPYRAEGSGGGDAPVDSTTGGETSTGDGAASEGGDSSVGDATTDGSDGATESSSTDGPHDASEEQATDAVSDAPGCDKDGDHDLAKGGVCGSTDCDDNDARAFFGEPDFLTFTPTPVTNGDWNCDGVVTPQFTTGFSCGLLSLGSCGTASGFSDTPGCGASSPNFITCHVQAGVLCQTDTTTTNTQGCK